MPVARSVCMPAIIGLAPLMPNVGADMAELIGALVEAIAGMITAIAEAIPAIVEALAYIAVGAITIIAYALSRQFRERKRREWKERPKWKYLDLGIGGACLGVLVGLGVWIVLPRSQQAPLRGSPAVEEPQHSAEFRLVISRRSDQNSNELNIAVKKGMIAKLLHRKSSRESAQATTQGVPIAAGSTDLGTNLLQPSGPANGSQPLRSDTNSTPSAAGSHR